MSRSWWEHPDFYDLHDNTACAGVEREPEHYREFVIALPPLGSTDHLVDFGAGTGKLSALVAEAYPSLGRVTLVEPNEAKLARARERLAERLGEDRVYGIASGLGYGTLPPVPEATAAIVGSVFMPVLLLGGGRLLDGLAWLDRALREAAAILAPRAPLVDLETLAMPWDVGPLDGPVRRLTLSELTHAFGHAGLTSVECLYRFRDRVTLRAERA